MEIAIFAIWVIGIIIYFRASYQAEGRVKSKLTNADNFITWQKFLALIFVVGEILSLISGQISFIYLFAANLFILFLFYLQPTPRTTKKVLWVFILINVIFALYLLIR